MATFEYDPNWVKTTVSDCWNFLVSQLGHWNKLKIIAMDQSMYKRLGAPVLEGLRAEAMKSVGVECVWAIDGCNTSVHLLGPVKLFAPNLIKDDMGAFVWDPKHVHKSPAMKRGKATAAEKTPRPPNAFILYRKDMHGDIKKQYPDIHNNEISVLAGSMWKAESAEVRAKYYAKSVAIKDQLIRAQPNYRYQPRRSADIKRRVRVTTADGSPMAMAPEQQEILHQLYPGITSIRVDPLTSSTNIFQESHVPRSKGPINIDDWVPNQALFNAPGAMGPTQQLVLFGNQVPAIDYSAALIPAGTSTANGAEQEEDDEENEDEMEDDDAEEDDDDAEEDDAINAGQNNITDLDNFNAAMFGM